MDNLERVHQTATKMTTCVEYMANKEKLEEMGLFTLEKREKPEGGIDKSLQIQGRLIMRKMVIDYSVSTGDMTRSNGHQLQHRTFRLHTF